MGGKCLSPRCVHSRFWHLEERPGPFSKSNEHWTKTSVQEMLLVSLGSRDKEELPVKEDHNEAEH